MTDGLYEFSTSETDIYGWDEMVEWFEAHRRSDPAPVIWDARAFHTLIVDSRAKQGIEQEDDETLLILTREKP